MTKKVGDRPVNTGDWGTTVIKLDYRNTKFLGEMPEKQMHRTPASTTLKEQQAIYFVQQTIKVLNSDVRPIVIVRTQPKWLDLSVPMMVDSFN